MHACCSLWWFGVQCSSYVKHYNVHTQYTHSDFLQASRVHFQHVCTYLINTASNFVLYRSTLARLQQVAWSHLKVYSRLHMCTWSVMCATLLPFLQHVLVTPLVLLLASLATPSVGSAPARQESRGSVVTGATMGSTTSHRMAAEVNKNHMTCRRT